MYVLGTGLLSLGEGTETRLTPFWAFSYLKALRTMWPGTGRSLSMPTTEARAFWALRPCSGLPLTLSLPDCHLLSRRNRGGKYGEEKEEKCKATSSFLPSCDMNMRAHTRT